MSNQSKQSQSAPRLSAAEIRLRFLAFFKAQNHAIIPSASLVTADEKGLTNATLFNTAGMQPLIPFLLGKPHPLGRRLANSQKCVRTVDLDEVGDSTHATFFEMLGNWSLGDYFKKEAINWSYEFLTSKEKGLGLDPSRLYVTVFAGDENAERDDEAVAIWKEIFAKNGIEGGDTDTRAGQSGRIFYLPAAKNWWQAGENGPCGPDTEMYYDVENTHAGKTLTHEQFISADDNKQVVEVWNDVFMQYEKKDGVIVGKLPAPSVDTGAGLERLAMTLQGVNNIYETDLFIPIMAVTKTLTTDLTSQRIIADHLRAATFLIADGVLPSNTDRGYILRRLIRRAVFKTSNKQLDSTTISNLVNAVLSIYRDSYSEIHDKAEHVKQVLINEADKFSKAIDHGLKELEKIVSNTKGDTISGVDAFTLFSSYGLPIDMTASFALDTGKKINLAEFESEFKKHQELSRVGAEKKFKGGLEDPNNEMVVRYHTATHLLHQALHDVLGEGVMQKGSNITAERLRFDFSFGAKMTDEQKKKVEDIVNAKMSESLPMNKVVLPIAEAEKTGARHFFGEKYGDEVSIYFVGQNLESAYSKEFCGGPHVKNTAELMGPEKKWKFKIQKEEAISQGVRRIKAVLA